MVETRGKGQTQEAKEVKEESYHKNCKFKLGPNEANPPQVLLLPKDASKDARIITLEDPRYFHDSRYLVCPDKGFYELRKISAPINTPRSWLISSDTGAVGEKGGREEYLEYVTQAADLLIATAIDPLFLVLPALDPPSVTKVSERQKKLFLSSDHYLERMLASSPQLGSFSRINSITILLRRRMEAVCETVHAGDVVMYRLSEEKLLNELLRKCRGMVDNGLPQSMEERFIRKALEVPIFSTPREEGSECELAQGEVPQATETPNTHTTVSSVDTDVTYSLQTPTPVTSATKSTDGRISIPQDMHQITAPEGVTDLLRLRTAFFFLCASYIAPHISESLKNFITSSTIVDFAPLDTYLSHLTKLRQDALSARSLGDYSRKRSMMDDEESELRVEKRRKEEERKKKAANESRGFKALKKVNVAGMKKMSDFFKKK